MPRLLFTKTGEAVWMSHLDLMRLFQRAFKRAGLPLKHTQGYNPRPSVSIALPLSVGVESVCELLDFDLEGEAVGCDEITSRINNALVSGIQVLKTYENGRKIKDLALLDCVLTMEYDGGIPAGAEEKLLELFASESLLVEKKGKNGTTQQDIIPMIRSLTVTRQDPHVLQMNARICCQNPSLNPTQLVSAISLYLPQYAPDHTVCRRLEILDGNEKEFR
jgi:radical SAM-linked protein